MITSSFTETNSEARARLACVRRTASVHSEPGSNSSKRVICIPKTEVSGK